MSNRKSEIVGGTPEVAMPTSSTASYTAASNQVANVNDGAGLAYDAAGDVTQDPLNSYLYDAEGRLCAARTAGPSLTGYIYDASGTRVAKGSLTSFSCNFAANGFTPTASYVLGPGGEQVTEYAVSGPAGNYSSNWVHTNAFSGGKIQATYHDTGTYFYLGDWLGTKRVEVGNMVVGGTAQLCAAAFTSLAYGDGLTTVALPGYAPCIDATEHHFTGKERDNESGNDFFEARYYSSAMGRFLSPDWSAKAQPVPYAKMDDPQTLNLYGYLRNNPLGGVDADGHCGGGPNDPPCTDVSVTIATGSDGKPAVIQPTAPGEFDLPGMAPQYGVMGAVTFQVTQGGKPLANAPVSESVTNKRTVNGKPAPAQPQTPSQSTDSKGQLYDAIGDTQNTHGADSLTRAATSFYDNNNVSSVTDRTITVQGQGCSASFTSTATLTSTPGQKPAITVTDPKPVPPPPPPPPPKPQTR